MTKKLGQHFLKNKKKIKKIINSLKLEESDKVLEIGPGKGALTKSLGEVNKKIKIIAVERDKNLVDYLKNNLVQKIRNTGKEIEIVYGDILKKLPYISKNLDDYGDYKIVGNIPYYITGKLFRVFGELTKKPKLIVITIQKEVADRLICKPPNMNILAASVKFWADAEKITNISRNSFSPVPDVDSAVIKLTPKKEINNLSEIYYKTVRIAFKHPRKTLLNNLDIGMDREKKELSNNIKKIGISYNDRPQNLSVEKIKELSTLLYNE